LSRIATLLVCACLWGSAISVAQDLSAPPLPDPIPAGASIGEVRIVAADIFDPAHPGENNWIFRTANRVHLETRPSVIARQLLFKTGDPYLPERLAESERLLRLNAYLYDAKIRPVAYHDGKVDVEVTTRDVWTLNLGAGFSRAGGKNFTTFQIEDSNFLGTGKEVSILRTSDVDRTSNVVRYRDPNLLGSRVQLETAYADNSDGRRGRFDLDRPFYSLDTRWSARLRGIRDSRELSLFELGKAFQTFRRKQDFLELQGGLSRGLVNGRAHRLRFGFSYDRNRFESLTVIEPTPRPGPGAIPKPKRTLAPPPPRTLAFPWIALDSVDDGYIEERDLNRIERTEDLNLGRQTHFRVGYSSPSFGGDRNQAVGEASGSAGWKPTPGQLLLTSGGVATRYGSGGIADLAASFRLRYSVRDLGKNLLFVAFYGDVLHRPDADHQLLLGGENGLRGYPIRFQAGDRRVLLTLEQRFYWDREIFHLAHLGAAVFFDAGQAWFLESPTLQQRQLLKDIGLGLRIASSRSARGAVVHLDVAFPLDRGRGADSVQYLVSTQETF
jgi:hypothetical protein